MRTVVERMAVRLVGVRKTGKRKRKRKKKRFEEEGSRSGFEVALLQDMCISTFTSDLSHMPVAASTMRTVTSRDHARDQAAGLFAI